MYTQKRTHTYMDVCARGISDVTRFHRVSRMIIDDFGELCLTNAHLAFRPKGCSRRFAPQNDNGYAFALLHMCILPHLRITTNGNYHNTILPLRFEDNKHILNMSIDIFANFEVYYKTT